MVFRIGVSFVVIKQEGSCEGYPVLLLLAVEDLLVELDDIVIIDAPVVIEVIG